VCFNKNLAIVLKYENNPVYFTYMYTAVGTCYVCGEYEGNYCRI